MSLLRLLDDNKTHSTAQHKLYTTGLRAHFTVPSNSLGLHIIPLRLQNLAPVFGPPKKTGSQRLLPFI